MAEAPWVRFEGEKFRDELTRFKLAHHPFATHPFFDRLEKGRGPQASGPGMGHPVLPVARRRSPSRWPSGSRTAPGSPGQRPLPPNDPRPARRGGGRPQRQGAGPSGALAPVLRGARTPAGHGAEHAAPAQHDGRDRRFPLHEPNATLLRLGGRVVRTSERSALRPAPSRRSRSTTTSTTPISSTTSSTSRPTSSTASGSGRSSRTSPRPRRSASRCGTRCSGGSPSTRCSSTESSPPPAAVRPRSSLNRTRGFGAAMTETGRVFRPRRAVRPSAPGSGEREAPGGRRPDVPRTRPGPPSASPSTLKLLRETDVRKNDPNAPLVPGPGPTLVLGPARPRGLDGPDRRARGARPAGPRASGRRRGPAHRHQGGRPRGSPRSSTREPG